MYALCANIEFGASRNREAITLRKPSTVAINKSWKLLTDTAEITIPRNVRDFDKQKVRDVFRAGDPVVINLGYNGTYYKEFSGFVSRVSADVPIRIQCEDLMWKLKQIPVHISKPNTTLPDFMQEIVTNYAVDAAEYEIGPVRYPNYTVATVLDDLKKRFNFYSYMRGETLVCGKIYADDTAVEPINLHLEKNTYSNTLEYRNADDIQIKIKAVSTLNNGKKLSVEVGDEGGEVRQLPYFGIDSEAALKKLAQADYDKYKVDAYRGGLTTFGIPQVEHGMKVNLISDIYPERNGIYYVESVRVNFGQSYKYARVLTLGDKAV